MAVKPSDLTTKENLLDALKAERDAAWAAYNPNIDPSRQNDWVRFAEANAAWHKAYTAIYGQEPEEDATEIAATKNYAKRRYHSKSEPVEDNKPVKTDSERDKGNRRKQHAPDWANQPAQQLSDKAVPAKKAS